MGFYNIPTRFIKIQQKSRSPKFKTGGNIGAGDIIISNHTSYVEILYLMFRFSPIFTYFISKDKSEQVQFIVVNSFSKILEIMFDVKPKIENTMNIKELIQYGKERNSPIVLFPEGTTSNGKSVLQCFNVMDGLNREQALKVNVLGFKYEFEDFSPSYTVGSSLKHLFILCCQFHNSLEVRYLATTEMESIVNENISESICSSLTSILRVHKVSLNVNDKQDFKDYWYGHKKVYNRE